MLMACNYKHYQGENMPISKALSCIPQELLPKQKQHSCPHTELRTLHPTMTLQSRNSSTVRILKSWARPVPYNNSFNAEVAQLSSHQNISVLPPTVTAFPNRSRYRRRQEDLLCGPDSLLPDVFLSAYYPLAKSVITC